ncbi:thiamine pyrophosphate-binding protein [Paenibacillus mucilaginosus]|uniref:thiamine pyrophosphate-binding protein n=1 Tax=Paenibacillus mucilaginosus TaxID=61624 RepID=UPI0005A0404C|nr:thiamine pyrophosphate-binding protein [Paenibacillus mucilaginosus]MCG7211535.1 thiamine pyrophosphate-binding protein [Paenibacillus mucilaginosus]WDM30091.1 thiamine pyrophosphate-binding protein [Paenibacillus mucilaginosus]
MQTVAQQLVTHLVAWGVTHVFGIPGKPVTPLVVELDRQGITFVLSKHEGGAGLTAAGFAYGSRSLGVALGTAGPGGVNMLTAAGQALASNLPVLFLTGQPPIREIGKVLGQDSTMFGTDLVKMFEAVTKFSARVERGDLLQTYLQHAMEQAFTGARGPVHLSIPSDVLMEEIQEFELALPTHYPPVLSSNLQEVSDLLNSTERPLLLLGGGVHNQGAYRELAAFAELYNLPVITTPGGKGAFPTVHPLSVGPFGLGGTEEARDVLAQGIDVLVAVGTQLSDMETAGMGPELFPKQVVQFDYDARFVGKALPVPTIPVLGDLTANLRKLAELGSAREAQRELEAAAREAVACAREAVPVAEDCGGMLTGEQVMKVLRRALPAASQMFGDAGSHSFHAVKHFEVLEAGTFHFEEVYATMGRAIGYSIGAQLAEPDRVVVCLTGDGCMFMNGTEVSTAVNYGAPVIFVVLNNERLDMVDKGMARHLGRAIGTVYETPLHAALFGESMGALSYRCRTAQELRDAVEAALAARQTAVIEVMVDPTEIPPTMARG